MAEKGHRYKEKKDDEKILNFHNYNFCVGPGNRVGLWTSLELEGNLIFIQRNKTKA